MRPVNRFVADFIGDTNLIDATVVGEENGFFCCRGVGGLEFLASATNYAPAGAKVTLAIRPEKIVVRSPGNDGTIAQTVYVGTDTNYDVRLTDNSRLNVRVQNNLDGRAQFRVGDPVGIDVPVGAARLLQD